MLVELKPGLAVNHHSVIAIHVTTSCARPALRIALTQDSFTLPVETEAEAYSMYASFMQKLTFVQTYAGAEPITTFQE